MNHRPKLARATRFALVLCAISIPAFAQGSNDCASAQSISGYGPFLFDTTAAPTTPGVPGCRTTPDRVDVWFQWTATQDALVTVEVNADVMWGVYTTLYRGTDCGSIEQVGCGWHGESLNYPSIPARVDAGEHYFLQISPGYAGQSGTGSFTVTESVPLLNPATGSQYAVMPGAVSWSVADERARFMTWDQRGGGLATLTTAAERDWVIQNLAPGHVWVSAYQDQTSPSYSEPSGGWFWQDGVVADLPWAPGEPNNEGTHGQQNAHMNSAGFFMDVLSNEPADSILVEWTPGIGDNYCAANPNSTGATGSMELLGSAVIAVDDLTLVASNLPVGATAFFLVSEDRGFIPNPAGSAGNLCISGPIGRFVGPGQVQMVPSSGSVSLPIHLWGIPSPWGLQTGEPGDLYHFQAWHRDAIGGVATSNFTDGVSVMLL